MTVIERRAGQSEFSSSVKENFDYQCSFPDCEINQPSFLIGAHIARWADYPELRGNISNGLCLCVLHDHAFELGYFTLNENFEIKLHPTKDKLDFLSNFAGRKIKTPKNQLSVDCLKKHWYRTGYDDND